MDKVPEASVESLTKQVLAGNFAATFVHVCYCFLGVRLAHLPRYRQPPPYVRRNIDPKGDENQCGSCSLALR